MDIQITSSLQSGTGTTDIARQARAVAPEGVAPSAPPQVGASVGNLHPATPSATYANVQGALETLNKAVQNLSHGSSLEFTIDQDTHINVVKVVDKTTHEIIRQMPTKEALEIAKAVDELQGLIIRQKA